MIARWCSAYRKHRDFVLLALLYSAFRAMAILLFRPGGFIMDGPEVNYYLSFAALSDRGLFPFVHYWMEYPPIFPWMAVLAYRLSSAIPLWLDPRLWFNTILHSLFLPFDVLSFVLLYAIALRLYDRRGAVRCAWIYSGLAMPLLIGLGWFDVLPLAFLLLAVYALVSQRPSLGGIATGLGFMTKILPLLALPIGLRCLPSRKRKLSYMTFTVVVILGLSLPFLVVSPTFFLASFHNMLTRSSWETIWAVLDGYFGSGGTVSLDLRFDPVAAGLPRHPSRFPWLIVFIAGALVYFWILTRELDWESPRVVVAFSGLTIQGFLLISKGYSVQFILYVLPFIVLLLPNLRGVAYALCLSIINLVEWPIYFNLIPTDPWLLVWVVVGRTLFFSLLGLEYSLQLLPGWVKPQALRGLFVGTAVTVALTGSVVAVRAARTYVAGRRAAEPLLAVVKGIPADDRAAVGFLLPQETLYRRLRPLLPQSATPLLWPSLAEELEAPEVRWLEETIQRYPKLYLIYDFRDETRRDFNLAIERELSLRACKIMTTWVDSARVSEYTTAVPSIGHPTQASFAGQIGLEEYRLDRGPFQPGQSVCVLFVWRALAQPREDYTVFVHLIDDVNRIITQRDDQPVGGFRPSSAWGADERVEDRHGLTIPNDVAAGDYQLIVGLYRASTGERLMVLDATGQAESDHFLLSKIRITN